MAKVSAGMNAPPAPCKARDAMSARSEVESAHATDPRVNTTMPTRKNRFRPKRSPNAPPSGMKAARLRA